MKRKAIALTTALVIAGGTAAACTANSDQGHVSPQQSWAQTHPATPQGNERRDLGSFVLDDRSSGGVSDIWVKYVITNHSSRTSDYSFDWEALNSKGERVDNGTEMETNVRPGQTVRSDDVTTLETASGITVHVTHFDRSESY